ncbi:TetR family transcriptional regulator [Flavobacterium sp. Sd200]|nr:TetR family transcriptional regulator [Flavobacterium sp. Sd200]
MSKAEQTRQFIIETTAPIFNQKGYAGTSISDLTGATGLTKGSIYGNFESKDEVALAAFDYNHALIKAAIKQHMDHAVHPLDKLSAYLKVFADFNYLKVLKYGCPVLNTAIEADDTHEPLRKKAVGALNGWYNNIKELLQEAEDNRQVRLGVNKDDFAGAYIALIEGGIMIAKVTGKRQGLDAAVKQAKKMIKDIVVE